jgi:hypothetical protein
MARFTPGKQKMKYFTKSWFKFTSLSAIALLWSACGGPQNVIPKAPAPQAWQPLPDAPISSLQIPIRLRIDELRNNIEGKFPAELFNQADLALQGCPFGDCRLGVQILRNGPLQITANPDGSLKIKLPVKANLRMGFAQSLGFTTVRKSQDFNAAFDIIADSKVSIGPEWQLLTKTTADFRMSQAIFPLQLPVVGTWNLNLAPLVEAPMRLALKRQWLDIDKMIAQQANLRPFAEKFWAGLAEPVALMPNPPVWLLLQPQQIQVQNPRAIGNELHLGIGLKSKFWVQAGTKPQAQKMPALPKVQESQLGQSNFDLQVPLRVDYAEIGKLAQNAIGGKEQNLDGRKIILDQIEVYGNGDKIVVKTAFNHLSSPKAKGVLYFEAKPIFDPATQTLSVAQFDLNTDTKNVLVKGLSWMANGMLSGLLKDYMKVDLKGQMDTLKTQTAQSLKNIDLAGIALLNGQIQNLQVTQVQPTQGGLLVYVRAGGGLNIQTKGIK